MACWFSTLQMLPPLRGWPLVMCLAAFCLVSSLPLASLELGLLVLLPTITGLLCALEIRSWQTAPVDLITAVLMIPAIAMSLTYSLYLLQADLAHFRGRPERPSTSRGSLMTGAVTALLGGLTLALQRETAPYGWALTVFSIMAPGLLVSRVLLPAGTGMLLRRCACGGSPRLYHLMGGLWCLLYLLIIHFVLLVIAVPAAAIMHPRDRIRRAKTLRRGARPGLAALVYTFPYGRVICHGVSRAAFAKPAIIVSNHQSIVDIPLLSRIPCDLRLTIKGQWWTHRLIGAGVKALKHIRVEPGDPDAVLQQGVQAFAEGSSIHFFPEGTRSLCEAPTRFHKGAFELAIHLGAEIQPLVLCDTWTCLPRGGIWVEQFCMRMNVLPRITPSTFDYSLGARALARHTEEQLSRAWVEELNQNNTLPVLRRKVERLYRYQGVRAELDVFLRVRRDPGLAGLHALLPADGLVLDLGCGHGAIAHWLAQAGPERKVLGVDRDAGKIRVAQSSACCSRQVAFKEHDFCEWPLPACRAILLLDIFEDFTTPEAGAILRKSFDALTQGGRLIVRVAPLRDQARSSAITRACTESLKALGFATVDQAGPAPDGRPVLVAGKAASSAAPR
jgi:1-acyl-sn-glycerol-3-phosphate acyltransferase